MDRDLLPVSLPKHLQGEQLCSLGLMAQRLGVSRAEDHMCTRSCTCMDTLYLQKNMQAFG